MAIPDYQTLMLPLLRLAGDGGIHSTTEAIDHVALAFATTPEERAQLLPSGRTPVLNNRTHWALTYLRHAGMLERAGHGKFRITDRGRQILANPPPVFDRAYLAHFPEFREFLGVSGESPAGGAIEPRATLSPEERLEAVYRDLRSEIEHELLERLRSGTPTFFERAVLDVLTGMGYGGSREQAQRHLGRPGDEGLDGVIDEDPLGLEKVYVQAKRYADPVGQEKVRSFAGSLDGAHARKGVLITTSTFSPDARRWVEKIEKHVVLIDGAQLARYMVDYEIGVQRKAEYRLYRLDDDFFEPAE